MVTINRQGKSKLTSLDSRVRVGQEHTINVRSFLILSHLGRFVVRFAHGTVMFDFFDELFHWHLAAESRWYDRIKGLGRRTSRLRHRRRQYRRSCHGHDAFVAKSDSALLDIHRLALLPKVILPVLGLRQRGHIALPAYWRLLDKVIPVVIIYLALQVVYHSHRIRGLVRVWDLRQPPTVLPNQLLLLHL